MSKPFLPFRCLQVVEWCRNRISSVWASISRKGKDWYVAVDDCIMRSIYQTRKRALRKRGKRSSGIR
ncbi:DUF3781 domain-containing protein [Enterococcus faecium]|uniref:DUF3781 domain-containing protein n=1 Tax=Blautia celeris TaxID=2763026 RepID=A0ABR7FKK7_9FIRM|nr:DUF3781 domain-containing protein [Blautia celeris]MBS5265924.1 DUF3781 domain-containing protein [Clostridiales bacterium]NSJ15939.1 DUF3781 domain-containing protein [[Clostridium] scindens]RHP78460.1 DUF3781 domain-containing protein [Blautia sp. OF01-4LB]TYO60603.1 DUF3781 domain-containing protein [Enterococcus faecium]